MSKSRTFPLADVRLFTSLHIAPLIGLNIKIDFNLCIIVEIENPLKEKEERFEAALKQLDDVTDGLGLEIEAEIRETITALNLLGIPTSGSCRGHNEEERISFPYIMGEAPDEPAYRYIGEEEIVLMLLKKYGLERMNYIFLDDDAEKEYYTLTNDLEESDEYKRWYEKNKPLEIEVGKLLEEFNSSNPEVQLCLDPVHPGYRIEANVKDTEEIAEGPKRELVIQSQRTFESFKAFLKNKYFTS